MPLLLATELHWRCSSYGTKSARNGSSGTVCEQGHEKREKLSDDPCPYPCVFLASRRGRKSRCHASSRRERQANTRQATVLYHWCILLLHVLATISWMYATDIRDRDSQVYLAQDTRLLYWRCKARTVCKHGEGVYITLQFNVHPLMTCTGGTALWAAPLKTHHAQKDTYGTEIN